MGPSHRGGKRIKRPTTEPENPRNELSVTVSPSEDLAHIPQDQAQQEPDDEGYQRRLPSWPHFTSESRNSSSFGPDAPTSHPSTKLTVDESIVSTNLQNPSDALEFLAHVAGRTDGAPSPSTRGSIYSRSPHQSGGDQRVQVATPSSNHPSPSMNQIQFPPYQKGQVSLGMMHALIDR